MRIISSDTRMKNKIELFVCFLCFHSFLSMSFSFSTPFRAVNDESFHTIAHGNTNQN